MPGTITVGLDGTDHSLAAADWAAAEAARRGMALRLVHAWMWQPLDAAVAADADVQQQWAAGVLREAQERLSTAFPDLTVTSELVPAEPVPALLAEAARADLLVLGSRGHGAVVGHLLGSVSLKVLRQAVRPVVLVRPARLDEPGPTMDEVVVGVQETEETGGPVLDFAFAAAAARDARVRAVRAWTVPPVFAWSPGSIYLADEAGGLEALEAKRLAEALRPWREKYPQVEVVEHVEIGSAAEVLLSNGSGAALMVVGRRLPGSHDFRRLGSVAHAALHHALCPVAVVPHP
ncbi:universal stress protein [Streptomyces abikoensis]|uniref:universal stress protein n=1 Tax=Streptomyces abikoensis TaxID=97398 RepID=UPI0016759D67|nr:universal stress protein [Streptomyces abikoensis]GGP34018.1 universal stress protein [Streptomyces abikoensis]